MNLIRFIMSAAFLAAIALSGHAVEAREAPVALDGNCAVCLVNSQKIVKGKQEFKTVYDGQTYLFPSEEVKQKFLAQPEKYVPALNGDCTVCFAHHAGVRNPGTVNHVSVYQGRLFLFPNEQIKSIFDKSPAQYADVDLACDGKCIVCKVDGSKDVPGKAKFTAIYQGMRYQFPSQAVMQKFQAAPEKYVSRFKSASGSSETDSQLVSVTGTTGCAACEFGVHPKKNPEELGLAVKSADGKIYVIEGAHDSHPKIYQSRFDGLKIKVKGKQIAAKGKFVWLDPQSVETLN